MNNIGWPAEFFNCFQSSFTEKNCAQAVIVKPFFLFIMKNVFSFKKIFIIQEIYLQPRIRKRSHLDLQGQIIIIHRNVYARQAYNLMQSVTAFINYPKTWHNTTDFKSTVVGFNCKFVYNLRKFRQFKVG